MEEIATRIIRFLGYLFFIPTLSALFYCIGWPFVKSLTFGKYPQQSRRSHSIEEIYVICVGVAVCAIAFMASLGQFGT